jgi:CHAT domain-containing protein
LPAKVGVKSVLASIWNVNDPGALIFMTLFYKNLKGGMSKSEALKDAQLALKDGVSIDELTSLESLLMEELRQKQGRNTEINQRLLLIAGFFKEKNKIIEELKNPYYWATFTLIGNPW